MSRNRNRNYDDFNNYSSPEEKAASPVYEETKEIPKLFPRKAVIVKSKVVNVRKAPLPTATVVHLVERGDKVEILESDRGYFRIQIEDENHFKHELGYISSEFCEEVD